ncbi:MAG: sulfatase [Chloroflexi bacterium]|nr:sulfatase [Chloroflexota bacterium]
MAKTPLKPNVILINCDDLGYGDLGSYGSKINRTPALDRMAEEGMRFTDFYMASPVCSPSRAAMMTGCYPPRVGFGAFDGRVVLFPGDGIGLNPQEITIARLLKDAGYATKLVGKWHCGDQEEFLPTRHGFDSYYGLPYSNDMGIQIDDESASPEAAAMRRGLPPLPLLRDEKVIQEQPDQSALTERYVEESVRFIRDNAASPFFLYLAHMHVHLPLYAPDRFIKESENGAYGAAVASIDWATSVIMDELKQLGLDENTLIIFTSDNGSRLAGQGGSNGALRGQKGTTWEGGQRVPCIMRWPSAISAGGECNELSSAIDLYPTLAALGGADVPTDRTIDGKDIRPLMFADQASGSPRDEFFYYKQNSLEAVRDGKWKLHVRKGDEEIQELYDLASDIGETRNLFDAHPEVVAALTAKLDLCRRDIGDEATGIVGEDIRPAGRVDNPDTLTHYDPEHPYIIAAYDSKERG